MNLNFALALSYVPDEFRFCYIKSVLGYRTFNFYREVGRNKRHPHKAMLVVSPERGLCLMFTNNVQEIYRPLKEGPAIITWGADGGMVYKKYFASPENHFYGNKYLTREVERNT